MKPKDGKTEFRTRFFGPVIADRSPMVLRFHSCDALPRLYELADLGDAQKAKISICNHPYQESYGLFTAIMLLAGKGFVDYSRWKICYPWLLPSINTLIVDGKKHLVPSPIVPPIGPRLLGNGFGKTSRASWTYLNKSKCKVRPLTERGLLKSPSSIRLKRKDPETKVSGSAGSI